MSRSQSQKRLRRALELRSTMIVQIVLNGRLDARQMELYLFAMADATPSVQLQEMHGQVPRSITTVAAF